LIRILKTIKPCSVLCIHYKRRKKMNRYWAGFLGGFIGGLARMSLEMLAFASGISEMNMMRSMGRLLAPMGTIPPGLNWLIHALVAGLVGLLITALAPRDYPKSVWSAGVVIGLITFGAMNLLLAVVGVSPAWALGFGSLLTNIFTHLVLGWIITYALYLSRTAAIQNNKSGNPE
jgi:hypothetical protein